MIKDAGLLIAGFLWGTFIYSGHATQKLHDLDKAHLNSLEKAYFTGCVLSEQPDILKCREKSIAYKEQMKKALGL